MKNTRNETTKVSKTKGSWDSILSDLKKHFTFQPDVDMKFVPPRENELLSSIEIRLNRYREANKIIKNSQTEKA
jgi:hypothetical protein